MNEPHRGGGLARSRNRSRFFHIPGPSCGSFSVPESVLIPGTVPVTCWACLGLPLVSEQTPTQPSEGLLSPHLASQGSTRL